MAKQRKEPIKAFRQYKRERYSSRLSTLCNLFDESNNYVKIFLKQKRSALSDYDKFQLLFDLIMITQRIEQEIEYLDISDKYKYVYKNIEVNEHNKKSLRERTYDLTIKDLKKHNFVVNDKNIDLYMTMPFYEDIHFMYELDADRDVLEFDCAKSFKQCK